MGDNIYDNGISSTKDKRFTEAMDLIRSNSHLKKVPLYSVLGNHDCYGSSKAAVEMNGKDYYYMDGDYYAKHWDNISILFLNACKLVCKDNRESHCKKMKVDYAKDKKAIDEHYEWIDKELGKIKDDRWVAVSIHWPATGL